MDASSCRESSSMEELRRLEITRGLNQAARDRSRAVRREKMRWAVSTCCSVATIAGTGTHVSELRGGV